MTVKLSSASHKGWLSTEREYVVLAIEAEHYRIEPDEGTTAVLFPIADFEIVSPAIPSRWIVARSKNGALTFKPAAWMRPGFLEELFDGVPSAVATYREERDRILAEQQRLG